MKPPHPHPFLGAEAGEATSSADALLLGLAADGGVSFRPGAVQAPEGIRRFSESIETYSPRAQRDLDDLRLIDLGDHDERESVERGGSGSLPLIEKVIAEVLDTAWTSDRRPLLVSIGGDHSVTPPAVRAVASRCEGLAVVGFDAHLDLREDYPGDHACTYRRISDGGVLCYVFGPRSGARSEWTDVPGVLAHCSQTLRMPADVRWALAGRPVYVTIDIDVLDPSDAPGTGNPEPGGPRFAELLGAIESLNGLDVVAFDIVEVSPPLDPSGITQVAAAVLVRELLLQFA